MEPRQQYPTDLTDNEAEPTNGSIILSVTWLRLSLLIGAGILSVVTIFAPVLLPANSSARLRAVLSAPIRPKLVQLTGRIETSDTSTDDHKNVRTFRPSTFFDYDRTNLILSLNSIHLLIRATNKFDMVCIRNIEFLFALIPNDDSWSRSEISQDLGISEERVCVPNIGEEILETDDSALAADVQKNITLGSIPKGYTSYLYPYDSIRIQARFRAILDYYKDGKFSHSEPVPTGMSISVGITGWELQIYDPDNSDYLFPLDLGREKQPVMESTNALILALKRPIFIKFLTPILLIMLYVVTLSIILFKPPDLVIEISIGVLMGVWGTRQILLPSEVQSWTLVDMALLVIYFLIVPIFAAQVLRQTWLLAKGTLASRGSRRSQSTLSKRSEIGVHTRFVQICAAVHICTNVAYTPSSNGTVMESFP